MKHIHLDQADFYRLDKIYNPQKADAATAIEYILDGVNSETGQSQRIGVSVDDAYTLKEQLDWYLGEGNLSEDEKPKTIVVEQIASINQEKDYVMIHCGLNCVKIQKDMFDSLIEFYNEEIKNEK